MNKLILTNAGFQTDYKPTVDTLIKMKFSSEPSIQAILGEVAVESEFDPSAIIVKIVKSEDKYYWAIRLGGYTNDTLTEYIAGEHSIEVSLGGIKIDGTFYPSEITQMRPSVGLGLCAINYMGMLKTTFEGEFYEASIYEKGELVERYVPAVEGNIEGIRLLKYKTIPGIGGTSVYEADVIPIQEVKEVTISNNGVTEIENDPGYSSVKKVVVTTEINPELIDVTISRAGRYTVSDFSETAYGIKNINVSNDEIPAFIYEAPEQLELKEDAFDQSPIEHTYVDGVGTVRFAVPVEEITDFAFFGSSITSMTLPSSLKRIGKGAFTDSADLAKITFLGYDEPEVAKDAFRHISDTGELHHIEDQELINFPVPEAWVRISDGKALYEVIKVTENGTYEASIGYDALKRVVVDVQPELEEKAVETAAEPIVVTTDKYGLSKVTIVPQLSEPESVFIENGEYEILPEDGTTMDSVKVTVDVNPPLQEVEINELQAEITPEEGYYGISKVTVDVPVEAKEETITENGEYIYPPDDEHKAISELKMTVDVQPELQEKTVDTLQAVVEADDSFYGLSKVTVDVPVEEKVEEITINGAYTFEPEEAAALSKVTINVAVPQGDEIYVTDKDLYVNANGVYQLKANVPEGYNVAYMSQSTINVDVRPILEERLIQGAGTYYPSTGFDGFSKVVVDINDSPVFEDKNITLTDNGEYTFVPDFGTDGFSQININVAIPGVVVEENGISTLVPLNGEYTTASGDKIKLSI